MPPKNSLARWLRSAPAVLCLVVVLGATLALAGCTNLPFFEIGTSSSPAATPPAGGSVALPAAGGTPVLIQLTPAPAVAAPLTPLATLTIMNTPTPGPTPQSLARTENILVLGTDTRSNMTAWRTDSIMVVAIDRTAGQVGIMNIPRDLWVNVPTYGQERINAADYIGEKTHYPGGGPALVSKIIQNLFGVPTQHWVRIQQDGIIKLVDALGGVEVNLDCPLYEAVPDSHSPTGYRKFVLPAGKNFLDGPTAKEFVTFRYITSDFGRERRQQQLIWSIRNRALRGDVLPRLPELWQALSGVFTTDLNLLDVASLAGIGIKLQGKDVHSMTLLADVQDYTTADGAKVLLLRDTTTARARLARIFSSTSLQDVGKPAAQTGCPKPPAGYPDLSSTIPDP